MSYTSVILIVAMTRYRVIGMNNKLPWHLQEDLQRFKRFTMGYPIIMGRRTYQSIGQVLPGRDNLVISRDRKLSIPGATVVNSLQSAIRLCKQFKKVFVIGGQQIYQDALPLADRIEMTILKKDFAGDAYFPQIEESDWDISSSDFYVSDNQELEYQFRTLIRKTSTRRK